MEGGMLPGRVRSHKPPETVSRERGEKGGRLKKGQVENSVSLLLWFPLGPDLPACLPASCAGPVGDAVAWERGIGKQALSPCPALKR